MHTPKHYLEYIFLRVTAGFVRSVPNVIAFTIGWGMAFIIHRIFRFRVAESRRRIAEVFCKRLTDKEISNIAWLSWRNICFNVVEIIRMHKVNEAYIKRYINHVELNKINQTMAEHHCGAVIATPHLGNWDLGGVAGHVMGLPFFFIARRQKNALTDAYLNKMRGVNGVETIMSDDRRMLREVIRRLKNGMAFAILPDVRAKTEALTIDYLNGKANLAQGMALFAKMANVPIIPTYTIRVGWFRHEWKISQPIFPDKTLSKEEDYQRMTQLVMDIFTQAVEKDPEQYFWFNKRWVLDPLKPDNT